MSARRTSRAISKAACLLLGMLFVSAPSLLGVEPTVPPSVDVYWKSTRTVTAPGVTSVIVLDEEIAHVQIGNDTIEVAGLSRGDTVALAYVKGAPVSILIHVIEHPIRVVPPSLLRRESELAHGVFGSDFQNSSSGGNSTFLLVNRVSWSQQMGDHYLDVNSQFEDNTQFGGHTVNLRTGGVAYRTPHITLDVLDFNQSLTGMDGQDQINNFSSASIMQLRGVDLSLNRGKNEYSFFAGTTVPYYFLSLNATRDVAGFTFHRKETDRLNLFGGTAFADIPVSLSDGLHRRSYVMQTAGASYRLSKGFLLGAQAGISNGGGLLRGDMSYSSYRLSGYATAILASQTFPLSQLQSLFSGTSSVKGALTYRTTQRLSQGLYFEHTTIAPGLIYHFRGSSDYLSPTFGFSLSPGENLNFSYTFSKNNGGFSTGTTTGNRYDVSLNSQLALRIANTAQFTMGSVQDPLQINSQDQFTVRDNVSIPIKGQSLQFGVEHDSVQPSLISKLNSELSLLSPALQAEFLANPTAFLDSSNFPPEIKALLAAEQPTGTTFSAAGNLSIGSKLRLNPTVSVTHTANGSSNESWTETFGYSASFLLKPTLQLRSSLTNVLLYNSQSNSSQRTTILSAGFQKAFSATPGALPLLHHSRVVSGRVYRDLNINGVDNPGEPGVEGVEVRLDDGQTATTDAQGRYRFLSVSAAQHVVSVDLTQFRNPVRMTTRSEAEADLIQQHTASVSFGILDFARVMGNVYNDLRFADHREPDSKGMQNVDLILDNGVNVRKAQTSGSGDFEFDNIPPGDYKVSLDTTSLPANYLAPVDSVPIHVSPVSTVVADIPMRALRSISGRLMLKVTSAQKSDPVAVVPEKQSRRKANLEVPPPAPVANEEPTFVPVPGVQIIAGPATSLTDNYGNFLLRNLPAGDLAVTIRPVKAVPEGIKIPSGMVKLPADPVQIQGATIVITNADLLRYLTLEFPPLPGQKEEPKVVAEAVAPRKQEKPAAIARSNSAPAKSVQPDIQRVAGGKESDKTDAPMVAEIVIPAHIHPAATLLRIPAVSPNSPVIAPTVRAGVPPSGSDAQSTGSSNAVQSICQNVASLADAARCIKMKRNAAMGTQQ